MVSSKKSLSKKTTGAKSASSKTIPKSMSKKKTKNVLVINGHPRKNTLTESLAKEYFKGAKEAGAKVTFVNLYDLKFELTFKNSKQKLEKDVLKMQKLLKSANHLVFAYPTWWGGMPALCHSFVERVFTSGFAYDFDKKTELPTPLFINKSVRIITTMSMPHFIYEFSSLGRGWHKIIKHGIFRFVGMHPVRFSVFGRVHRVSKKKILRWLAHTKKQGTLSR